MKTKTKNILLIVIIVLLILACVYVVGSAIMSKTKEVKNPIVSLEIENYGTVKIELYPEYAPNTVKNIVKLVENGYYNGKVFYGSDDISVYVGRNTDGQITYPTLSTLDNTVSSDDDYEYEINGEFVANNFENNTLLHEEGVVSLVRADYTQTLGSALQEQSYNSGSSQFTILTKDAQGLNGMYAAFGKVVEGMDIVNKIYGLDKLEEGEESISQFATMPIITNASVETFGTNYGYPDVHKAFDYEGYMQQILSQHYTNNQ